MEKKVKILSIESLTHDVRRYTVEKPEGYEFVPGQATLVGIDMEGWEDKFHPFTFTSLTSDTNLEFTIKSYKVAENPTHTGLTEKLLSLVVGDSLLIQDPWGTINYKGEGIFIAGGAGITPFIAILRDLKSKGEIGANRLFFSNKTSADIILKDELIDIFKDHPENLIFTLTREESSEYQYGRINAEFLRKNIENFKTHFYICGPRPMKMELIEIVEKLGADTQSIVFEQ